MFIDRNTILYIIIVTIDLCNGNKWSSIYHISNINILYYMVRRKTKEREKKKLFAFSKSLRTLFRI